MARFELAVRNSRLCPVTSVRTSEGSISRAALLQITESLAKGITRRHVRLDGDRAQLVETPKLLGHHRLVHLHHVGELHHFALWRAHEDARQSGRRSPLFGLELHHHAVLLAIELVARHLSSAEQGFHRPADHRYVEAEIGDLGPVDVHGKFGRIEIEVRIDVDKSRIAFDALDQTVGIFLELLIRARCLHHELHRPRRRP